MGFEKGNRANHAARGPTIQRQDAWFINYAAELIEAMPSRIEKGTGGNQVLTKDDMASLKNWAGQTFHHPAQLLQ
jgi:hypothetical protein